MEIHYIVGFELLCGNEKETDINWVTRTFELVTCEKCRDLLLGEYDKEERV